MKLTGQHQRDIDAGLTTLQADPGTNRTALQALQIATESEYGAIYVDADNNFVFQDRSVTVASIASIVTQLENAYEVSKAEGSHSETSRKFAQQFDFLYT